MTNHQLLGRIGEAMAGTNQQTKEKEMTVGQFAETDPIFETLEQKTARRDIVEIMALTVEDLNREQARKQSPEALAQIEDWIKDQRPNLEVMLNAIYDSLKKANVTI